jgi:hypothetical protein
MYFPVLDAATGRLRSLWLAPMRMQRFQLRRASPEDTRWLCRTLARESARFASPVTVEEHQGGLEVRLPPSCSEA